MNVRFCPSCRSLILADFRFCPYCGAPAPRGPSLAEALSAPFERMGGGVFDEAARSLDRLEADMDLILEEMKKEGG